MSRVRSILRWVFLRGPAAFYELADSSPGLVSVLVLVALAVAGGQGAGIGALIAAATARPLSPAVDIGILTAVLALIGWFVMSLVVVGVLWVRGVAPAEAYGGPSSRSRAESRQEKEAATTRRWRRITVALGAGGRMWRDVTELLVHRAMR